MLPKLKTREFPFTLQCTYRRPSELAEFRHLLSLLSEMGFYGIELNLPNLDVISPLELRELLTSYNLTMTYVATGAYAKQRQLSLSASDPVLRREAIEGGKRNIDYAAEMGCGIILGFYKNRPQTDTLTPEHYLEQSLLELDAYAASRQVPVLLEATNRYESRVANALEDTAAYLQRANTSMFTILPDTYHMNIEESSPFQALIMQKESFRNIHFSDNNRFFPGYGCVRFSEYLDTLRTIQYQGTIGIEGNLKQDYETDLSICVNHLNQYL